ncbi:hypothetical protein AAE478_004219 [Parahypoxylon ruwenzoriense]
MGSISYNPTPEPIAIIGLSCKFAGDARNPEELWRLLAEGRSAWTEIPSSRFNAKGSYHPDPEKFSTMHVRGGHFLEEDIGLFDAGFFNFSAETAAALDPQFRLQLESVYEALENAGLSLVQIAGSNTSVFAGVWSHDYRESLIRDGENLPRSFATGTGSAFASNRVSHFFDLRGSSMTIDTGCSTALVALHQAVQSLRVGESNMSIVGASNVMLNPDTFKFMGTAGFLSPDGKSFAFDSRANGYGRGDGVATLVVKRLKDALAAGDPIRAVIRETLLNQDGKTDSITSPSQAAQEALMRDCYRKAGLNPRDTQYFEAHGTGTQTGDPLEAGAIAAVFNTGRSSDQALRIGSMKTNIGHTEATSGLASIIKVVLAMEKGIIPPSINFESANAKVPLEDGNIRIVREPEKWQTGPDGIRRASINNFGYGGTNAHVILETCDTWLCHAQAPAPTHKYKTKVLVLSAKSEQVCQSMVSNLKKYLESKKVSNEDALLENIIYTLGQRRTLFPWIAAHRVPFTRGVDEVINALDSPQFKPIRTSRQLRIGMVFTGQGAQWHAMGREIIVAYPTFKASLEEADGYLREFGADWSLMEELSRDPDSTRVNDTGLSIPICVALQISLVRLLKTWGVKPTAVTSHSSGEIAAAYTAGALNYKSAMAVAYYRAALAADKSFQGPVKGGMIAVGVGIEDTEKYLGRLTCGGKAVAACINSPSSVTVAGDLSAVQEIESMAKEDGVFARQLRMDTGYHSHHMEPIAGPYHEALCGTQLRAESTDTFEPIAFSSPVTGDRVFDIDEVGQPEHWIDSLLQPVRFVDAVTDMVLGDFDPSGSSVDIIIEVGPHTALGGPIKEILALPEFNGIKIPYYGCLVRKKDARDSIQDLAASLLREGYPLDMAAVNWPWGKFPHVYTLSDLPSYPWNHQTRHWYESRFNKAIRERSQPYHDLLGSINPWANPRAPSWRHILRASESTWVRDHHIQSSMLYPGAGFVCLAIEAIAQMTVLQSEAATDPKISSRAISGYSLRDVDIEQALIVPDGPEGIEIQTILCQVSNKAIGSQGWMHFEVVSVTSDAKWTRHARGMISVDFDNTDEASATPTMDTNELSCYTRRFDPNDFYSSLRSVGIKHGPKFQNIKSITQTSKDRLSVSTIVVADTTVPNSLPPDHLLHPTTLDSVIQTAYTALPGAGASQDSSKVPRSIEKLWVSNKIGRNPGHLFRATSTLTQVDSQSMRADISMVDDGNKESNISCVLNIKGLVFQSLGRSAIPEQQAKLWEKEVCNGVEWGPDMSLSQPEYLLSLRKQLSCTLDPTEEHLLIELRRVCIYFITDALKAVTLSDVEELDGHRKKYYTWMQAQAQLAASGRLGTDSAQWTLDDISERRRRISQVEKISVNGEIISVLGPYLADMLRGQQSPLELMTENNLLNKYHGYMFKCTRSFEQAATLLRRLMHKNPRSRILEIGAGTGGGTRHALPTLGNSKSGGPLASLYHFTDASTAFFKEAAEEFSEWSEILKFDKLDIEDDPASQGFEVSSYDIVIASHVFHETKSIDGALSNVRKLMKPGGTILIVEATQDQIDVQFVFGLLPSWWVGEEQERHSSPVASIPVWDRMLKDAGFTGVDLEVHDCESDDMYSVSTLLSTALLPQPQRLSSSNVAIVTSCRGPPPPAWLESLRASIVAAATGGLLPDVLTVESAEDSAYNGKICIFVGEVGIPLLRNLDAICFQGIKSMVTTCKGLLWVTRGGAVGYEDPRLALATGFLRTLRNEYVGRRYLTLDLELKASVWSESAIPAIMKVITASFGKADGAFVEDDHPEDFEYAERDGVILVPRIYKDMARNKAVLPEPTDYSAPSSVPREPLWQADRPLSMHVGIPGILDTLVFDDDRRPDLYKDVLTGNLVEIEPKAYGVNFRDVMVAMGQLEDRVMGIECAGIITRVGSEAASHGYAPGDHVFGVLRGPLATRACIEWTSVVHMPPNLTFQEAASVPMIFSTAFYSICSVARLQRGQSVLIHAAAGGVGQAAIMIAQHLGARIFATVGTPEKRELIMDRYHIPEDHIFSSRDASFAQRILAATNGRGVDVVLNSLSGPLLQASFDVLAPFGHFVEIGKRDLERNSYLEMRPFSRHASFSSVDMIAMIRHRQEDVHRVLVEVARLITDNIVTLVHPITVFPMDEAAKAFRRLQTGKHMGKVVLSIDPGVIVPVIPRRPEVKLRPDASYLIVGGFGGIGRSITTWMVEHGAKSLIIISRSAGNTEKTGTFIAQIQEAGCRDAILEQMTFDDYQAGILPKVHGVWYLNTQFQNAGDLDFFILLSSNVGILGNPSQSNYSAGGTYEDALSHTRVARGLPCVSIDFAPIKAVGHVAETAGVWERMSKLGYMCLDEDLMLDILESAILSPYDAQIVTGINVGPGSHWDRNGSSQLGRDARYLALRYLQRQDKDGSKGAGAGNNSLASQLAEVTSGSEAERIVSQAIAEKLADIFTLSVDDIDLAKPPSHYGVDSLVAVELRNMLASQMAAQVSSFGIMQSASLAALARDAIAKSGFAAALN